MYIRSPERTKEAKQYICEWLRNQGIELFCSTLLIDQITEQSQSFGNDKTTDLILEIKAHSETKFANWPRGSKKPNQFRKQPLKGLWKAHTLPQGFVDFSQNLLKEFDQKWIDKKLNRILEDLDGENMNEYSAGRIAHLVVIEAITNRGKRNNLTSGHWLIFSETPLGVFFLCRAHHEEDDRQIFERVCMAAEEFPNAMFQFGPSDH